VSGAVPVTTDGYALRETVGDRGILVSGSVGGFFYRRRFVDAVVNLLLDEEMWWRTARRARDDGLVRFAPATVCTRILDVAGIRSRS
jgi:hypothetical protein